MTTIVKGVIDSYDEFISSGDPRITKWTLTGSPMPILLSVVMYLLFVNYIGPAWMQKKKPFDLRYYMLLHNMLCIFVSFYIIRQTIGLLLIENSTGFCRVGSENDPNAVTLLETGWWFLLGKIVEFSDTVFFVLRKKTDHITKTHILHHSLMAITCWVGVRFEIGGPFIYAGLINGAVHAIMSVYYSLSTFGPRIQKYLWFKKYLTYLNIIQAVLILACIIMMRIENCKVSKFTSHMITIVTALFLVLFVLYFHTTYKVKKLSPKATSEHVVANNSNATTDTKKRDPLYNDGHQGSNKKKIS